MNKKEVLELRKRFKKDAASFSRIAGCYVDSDKHIVSTMNSQFLTLDDEEYYKYLDIAKKSISGKLGNNLLNLDFPIKEEKAGGRQQMLMALRDSELKNEELLQTFYEHVIDTYDEPGHYLILLYLDNYDVIKKGSDELSQDESDEVYKYLICSICPVDLAKAALSYKENENKIGSRIRDWVVGAPETAFLFPAFNDRSSDIHSTLLYAKKPKDVHTEFVKDGLGCEMVIPTDVRREIFANAVSGVSEDADEDMSSKVLGVCVDINKQAEDAGKDLGDFELTEDNFEKILKDNDFSDAEIKKVQRGCREIFDEDFVSADSFVNEKELEKQSRELGYKELAAENEKLKEEIERLNKELKELKG